MRYVSQKTNGSGLISMVRCLSIVTTVLLLQGPVAKCWAASPARAVLVIDESGPGMTNPGNFALADNLRRTLDAQSPPINVYLENLDAKHFRGPRYAEATRNFLTEKYRDLDLAVIVAVGDGAVEFVMQQMSVWREVPLVFVTANAETGSQLETARKDRPMTGTFANLSLATAITAGHILVPNLKSVALVGDRLELQPPRRHFVGQWPAVAANLDLIDLTGLPMSDLKKRVAQLPQDSVILYTAITRDGAGRDFIPQEAITEIAEVANRPIVVDVDDRIGRGGTGGYVVRPELMGQEAGALVRRVLAGEDASTIPMAASNTFAPMWDWNQLQRWGVSEARLPAGSQMRFRAPTMVEQYFWRIALIGLAFVLQSVLIVALISEDRRRRRAEHGATELRSELAHIDRVETAGQLSASIAHEVKQPLAAMVAHGQAGLRWLARTTPELDEARMSFTHIVEEGYRASRVVDGVRSMFRSARNSTSDKVFDVNGVISRVAMLESRELNGLKIELSMDLNDSPTPRIKGNEVQLQQVVFNLVKNAIEAMRAKADRARKLRIRSRVLNADHGSSVLIEVEDSGTGVDPKNIDQLFKPFFTTKQHGMGMGLSVCKSIIEAHHGQLTTMQTDFGGAGFRIVLPHSEPVH